MAIGLPVSDAVRVDINLSPIAAGRRNFGALLILGPSTVIDVSERLRVYGTLDAVASDFGVSAPEYQAAALFFSQAPQPSLVYIGRWAQTPATAVLHGGLRSVSQQAMSNFTGITNGSLQITANGTTKTVSGINLSTATNLNGVAAALTTALAGPVVTWDAARSRFDVISTVTGTASTLSYASATGAGTDLAGPLGLVSGVATPPVAGIAAETAVEAAQVLASRDGDWYGLLLAASGVSDAAHLALAAYIEGSSPARMYGVTVQAGAALDLTSTSDLGAVLHASGYRRTVWQYSSFSPYAVASLLGRAFTVDFTANNSTITLKFKQEPGVIPETLTSAQAAALKAKCGNVFVRYNNGTAIIQEGVMASGVFFDEVHGLDWLQNSIQTDVYNLLYTSSSKIPQTDRGNHEIVTVVEASCAQAVNNGLLAPGTWTGGGFGQLARGDTLSKGFYVFAPPIASQSQADREARKSVPIQVAGKGAGAIHFANVILNFNR